MRKADVREYLRRLGVPDPGRPTVAALRVLQAAHVERVPYETLEIHLGRSTTVDPAESVARVLRGRGGYCFHLNGAFGTLLRALGYDVVGRWGGVQGDVADPPGADGTHLALTVDCEDERWLVDVGLGDGPYEPLPLRVASHRQAPFTYRMRPSEVEPGGWRLDHDPGGSFAGMDFTVTEPAVPEDFAARHRELSTSPDSAFVRIASVLRRDAEGVDTLRGCVLGRIDEAGRRERELTTAGDWFEALAGIFGLTLADTDADERAALWARVRGAHDAWRASREGAASGSA
ncbi:arylamine N-acetyltransferase family protein [Streptomyces litchfieldiae]|uniref:Arylamine N-acetyltransferase n=1 Tax=Streptomyces litchfieldiae TaxID=3075543 RepID=A0ABU2MLD6_9ACTN|nr:arylamine N-acetyltransferase [Streptomyces sp. DSM 44938]MDT0341738.1 arylamine N-acetyltransferase [Streptomyces sp. DSM 44938]